MHPDPDGLAAAGQVALRYAGANPNGSVADIAGVCDATGIVLGLMPHPENHVLARQHPRHRLDRSTERTSGCACSKRRCAMSSETGAVDASRRLFEPSSTSTCRSPDRRDGKVRVSYACGDGQRLFVTTDRLSAFDRVLAGVPYKGQVLNQLSAWWFDRTADIVANHVIAVPDPNVLIARAATHAARSRSSSAATSPASPTRRCGAVRRRRPHDLRLPLPRRPAQEHAAARRHRHARPRRPAGSAGTTSR